LAQDVAGGGSGWHRAKAGRVGIVGETG